MIGNSRGDEEENGGIRYLKILNLSRTIKFDKFNM